MASVLVTGGAGYIGAHICKRLHQEGYRPVTLDNLSTGDAAAVKWGPLVFGDIADRSLAARIKDDHRPIAVLHAAALSDAAESVRLPRRYRLNNVEGTAALRSVFDDVPWVLSSSAAVYGSVDEVIDEAQELRPVNPYGETKRDCERLLPGAMWLRYFNVAGADPEIGFGGKPKTHLIPRALEAARSGQVFTVYGNGEALRDFVHVEDVAQANILAMRALLDGEHGMPLNICRGIGHSVMDVVRAVYAVARRDLMVAMVGPRPGDPERVVGRPDWAASVLRWAAERDLSWQIASMAMSR